ncbi:MAG: carbohydrate kinase family protein [Candidatus Paceibacterota bacterium]
MFNKKPKKIDFLAVGDMTTDAFIRLKDAEALMNNGTLELCVRFGDKVPYESVEVVRAVGNSANAAVSAAKFGLTSALFVNIGDDENGRECVDVLKKSNVLTNYIKINKGLPTNYHYVLWYGADRTILVKHTEYDYKFPQDLEEPSWIYLSSLAENTEKFHLEIAEYLKKHPDVKLSFQPGTFQMKLGTDKLKDLYKLSELFFCNTDEARRILNIGNSLNTSEKVSGKEDILELLKKMHELGPRIVFITDGPKGAYAYNGADALFIPCYPDIKPPLNRTGAGDAFASTITSMLALGKTLPEALMMGPVNSMHVVQYVGAQKGLLTIKEIEEYLKNAPEDYKVKKIN